MNEHNSDCPVNNEPAWPAGPCDCDASGDAPDQQAVAEVIAEPEFPPQGDKVLTAADAAADLAGEPRP